MAQELNRPRSLPQTTQELLAARKTNQRRTLTDHVNDIHVQLWQNPHYQRLLEAVWNEESVEGNLRADNQEAARMIRDVARKTSNVYLKDTPLVAISKSLNVVLNRYDHGRKQRRYLVTSLKVPAPMPANVEEPDAEE